MESKPEMSASKEFHHIRRLAGTDVDGTLKVNYALTKIKGIGITLANAITKKANVNPQARIGFLNEIDVQKLEDVIANPTKYGISPWMLNRQKDMETGKDTHLIGADLTLRIKTDIEELKTIKSWRGYRHAYGLRVRGQHTRTSGRMGKAMGVKKKEIRREATS
jgi:small subunit ribosomal protein S13